MRRSKRILYSVRRAVAVRDFAAQPHGQERAQGGDEQPAECEREQFGPVVDGDDRVGEAEPRAVAHRGEHPAVQGYTERHAQSAG